MSLLPESTLALFHDSFERCRYHQDFFDLFYQRFFDSSDEIPPVFVNVPMERVKKMVRDAFYFALMASDGSSFGYNKLMELGERHKSRGVKRQHYDLWLNSLISVVEQLDPRYDLTIDEAWRSVMVVGIHIMTVPLLESTAP